MSECIVSMQRCKFDKIHKILNMLACCYMYKMLKKYICKYCFTDADFSVYLQECDNTCCRFQFSLLASVTKTRIGYWSLNHEVQRISSIRYTFETATYDEQRLEIDIMKPIYDIATQLMNDFHNNEQCVKHYKKYKE